MSVRSLKRREAACHEHMNRDWKSWLNCLLFDDTKLRKEEEPGSGRSKISKVDASSGRVM
jgi:hypothetical protein